MKRIPTVQLCAPLLLLGAVASQPVLAAGSCSDLDFVDSKGNISLPENFRQNYTHLGSWFVPEGDASGFHDVYMDPASVKKYLKTKKFPDGAVMVKELRGAHRADYTTGANVARAVDSIKQTFVMIKDECGRHKGNPIWAEGWGWGLFSAEKGKPNMAKSFEADCKACHVPAQNTDWVYIDAYPTLNESTYSGEGSSMMSSGH